MSDDDEREEHNFGVFAERDARLIAASNAKAKHYLETAPRCDVCGKQVASPGRTRHYLCDPGWLAERDRKVPKGKR